VLSDIVVCLGLLVHIVPFEARVRHVFLIDTPANTLSFKQVDDSLDAGRNPLKAIVRNAVGAGSRSGDIVGLGWMCNGVIVRELCLSDNGVKGAGQLWTHQDPLRSEILQVC
jgi:hypothetical protein